MDPVQLFVIEDNRNPGSFLLRTNRGHPVFIGLNNARTFTTMKAVKNQVSRIKSEFDVTYRKVTLTLEGKGYSFGPVHY